MKVAVKTLDNKSAGDVTLSDELFGQEFRQDLLHRAVVYQLNKARSGTHKTKSISEISGTGKKPFNQKGTGRARAGSLRATQHRGGQTVFGPVVRSHATEMPKRVRALALKVALSAKARDGKLVVLDAATTKTHKTKDMAVALKALGLQSALIIDSQLDVNFSRAVGNIPHIDVLSVQGANVYDILRRETLVITKDAITKLEERLK